MLPHYASIHNELAPVIISRYDRMRMAALYSSLDRDFPLGNAIRDITETIEDRGLIPPGSSYTFLGVAELMEEALAEFGEAILSAIVLTYLVLAATLESFVRPFYIMLTVPMALIGMLWALRFTGISINIFVLLGGVLLIGIVVNNAVLIIDHMSQLEREGMDPGEAIVEAMALEFRPVVMITVAAAFGMWPLAVAAGLGSELTAPIGISSIGGIVISGVLTLLVIPLVFLILNPPKGNTPLPADSAARTLKRTSTRLFRKESSREMPPEA